MPHTPKNQKGFTVIEVLLVLILLSIVGFSGYYVYHTQKSSSTKPAISTTASSTSAGKDTTSTQTTTPSDSTQYLVIKEWGVKIPLSDAIKDAVYAYSVEYGAESAGLSTKTLAAYGDGCEAGGVGAGGIDRQTVTEHDQNAQKDDNMNYPVYSIKVGNYYYQYISPQGACSGDDRSADNVQLSAIQAFRAAVDKIQLN